MPWVTESLSPLKKGKVLTSAKFKIIMSPRKTLAPTLDKNTKASRESLCGVWLQPFKELTRLNKGN